MERAERILHPRQLAEPCGELGPVTPLETLAEVPHPSSGLSQVVKVRGSRTQCLAQVEGPGLVEQERRQMREQDIRPNGLERQGRQLSEFRLSQPVVESRDETVMARPRKSASDFPFRLATPLAQVAPCRLQRRFSIRPQFRRDFLGENLLLNVQVAQSSDYSYQAGQVFRSDLGRELNRCGTSPQSAAHSAARHSKVVDTIRGRIGGGLLFPLRHLLTSFPQRGQRVLAEGQVWDGASFRSSLSGFIVLRPVPNGEGQCEAPMAIPQ